jgi:predicted nicotinamide N-methyase
MNTLPGKIAVIVADDSADDVRWIEAESTHMEGTCAPARNRNATDTDADADGAGAGSNDDDDDDDDSPDMGDLFADPDPLDTFHFEYTLPRNETAVTETKNIVSITLTGHKAELGQTLHSTGLTLWRASELLCDYMIRQSQSSNTLQRKHVLELGAGLGLCGILAHHLQAANVVLTDGDTDALKFMRANVAANCMDTNTSSSVDEIENAKEGRHSTNRTIQCRQLVWGDNGRVDDLKHQYTDDNQGFHLVLGSDIIYVEEILDPLFQSVDRLLADGGAFWLAYARRNVKIDLVLETADRYGFTYETPDDTEGVFVFQRRHQQQQQGP